MNKFISPLVRNYPTTTSCAPHSVWHRANTEQANSEIPSVFMLSHGAFRLGPGAADKRQLLCHLSSSGRMVGCCWRRFLAFLCRQAVTTERRLLSFSSIPLLPQVILPFIKASTSHANSTVLL